MNQPLASRITGTGSAFPKRILTNRELVAQLDQKGIETSDQWIVERTGIKERRVLDLNDEKERNSSLAARASMLALEMAGKKPEDIDQIIFATASPDTMIPAAGCWLQMKIGAKNAAAWDLNAACSGFVYGVSIADQMIRAGGAETILVVGSDVLTTVLNWEDRGSCILFGDGGGAAIVEKTTADSESKILSSKILSDGTLWDLLYIPAGGSAEPLTAENIPQNMGKMTMKGKEIFKSAVRTLSEFALNELKKNGYTIDDLDWLVAHQANQRILDAVAVRLGISPEKVVINIDRFGNTSAGTVPTALDEAVRDGRIKKGDLVLLDAFGAGLTQGAVLLRW